MKYFVSISSQSLFLVLKKIFNHPSKVKLLETIMEHTADGGLSLDLDNKKLILTTEEKRIVYSQFLAENNGDADCLKSPALAMQLIGEIFTKYQHTLHHAIDDKRFHNKGFPSFFLGYLMDLTEVSLEAIAQQIVTESQRLYRKELIRYILTNVKYSPYKNNADHLELLGKNHLLQILYQEMIFSIENIHWSLKDLLSIDPNEKLAYEIDLNLVEDKKIYIFAEKGVNLSELHEYIQAMIDNEKRTYNIIHAASLLSNKSHSEPTRDSAKNLLIYHVEKHNAKFIASLQDLVASNEAEPLMWVMDVLKEAEKTSAITDQLCERIDERITQYYRDRIEIDSPYLYDIHENYKYNSKTLLTAAPSLLDYYANSIIDHLNRHLTNALQVLSTDKYIAQIKVQFEQQVKAVHERCKMRREIIEKAQQELDKIVPPILRKLSEVGSQCLFNALFTEQDVESYADQYRNLLINTTADPQVKSTLDTINAIDNGDDKRINKALSAIIDNMAYAKKIRNAELLVANRSLAHTITTVQNMTTDYVNTRLSSHYKENEVDALVHEFKNQVNQIIHTAEFSKSLKVLGSDVKSTASQEYLTQINAHLLTIDTAANAAKDRIRQANEAWKNLINTQLQKSLNTFKLKINDMEYKVKIEHKTEYSAVYDAATKLYNQINGLTKDYCLSGKATNQANVREFGNRVLEYTEADEMKILANPRYPFTYTLKCMAIALGTLATAGLLLIPALKFSWFTVETQKRVNDLKKAASEVHSEISIHRIALNKISTQGF